MDDSSLTILLIDGQVDDRQYWAHRLKISSPDYLVLEADSGATGLAICQSQRVDCVVLELSLPDMSGFEVLVKLVPLAHHPEVPVVVLSSLTFDILDRLAKDNGAQAFLMKSRISGDELNVAIHKAMASVGLCQKEIHNRI